MKRQAGATVARRAGHQRRILGTLTFVLVAGLLIGLDACASAGVVRLEATAPVGPEMVWPLPPQQPRIRFVRSFSTPRDLGFRRSFLGRVTDFIRGRGQSDGIQHPYGIAVTPDERIYVVDSSARGIHVFELLNGRYRFISKDDFRNPIGIAVDDGGTVFVSDSEAGIIFILDPDGDEVGRIDQGLLRPTGLAYSPVDDLLYAVDTGRHVVLAFTADGSLVRTIGERGVGKGQMNFPTNVAVDAEGLIYVADALNFRVQVFRPDGRTLETFGQLGDNVGSFVRPKGIGISAEGHVFVVEGLYDVVNIFDGQGRLLLNFGGAGNDDGQFWLATGLAVDHRNRIFVADSYNSRVQVFQLLGEPTP